MIRAHTDAILHNQIANHPAVFANICHDPQTAIDLTEQAGAWNFVLLSNGHDAATVWEWSAPNIYEVHSLFLPSCRGRDAIREGRAMIAWMFEHRNAEMLWGHTPIHLKAARWFNRQCGLQSRGTFVHPIRGALETFTIRRPA